MVCGTFPAPLYSLFCDCTLFSFNSGFQQGFKSCRLNWILYNMIFCTSAIWCSALHSVGCAHKGFYYCYRSCKNYLFFLRWWLTVLKSATIISTLYRSKTLEFFEAFFAALSILHTVWGLGMLMHPFPARSSTALGK